MEQFCLLTKKNNGAFGLPVAQDNVKTVAIDSVNFNVQSFKRWTDQQRRKRGLARVENVTVVASGEALTTTLLTEVLQDNYVKRTYKTIPIKVGPLKEQLRGRVNGARDEKIRAGIPIIVDAVPHVLETADQSRVDVGAVVAAIGASIPLPLNADGTPNVDGIGTHVSWRMRDNTDVLFDASSFVSLVASPVMRHVMACHLAARAHKVAVSNLTTYEDVTTYDLTANWPTVADPLSP